MGESRGEGLGPGGRSWHPTPCSVITSVITGMEEGLLGSQQSCLLVSPFPSGPHPSHRPSCALPTWPQPHSQLLLAGGLLWHRGAMGVGGGGSVHAPGLCPPSRVSSSILRATREETKTPAERGLGLWALSRWEILPGLPPSEYRSEVPEPPAFAQAGESFSTVPKAFWVRLRSRVLTEISLAESRGGEASFSTLLPRRKEAHILDTTAALSGNELPFPRCHQPPNTSWERSGSPHLSSPASPASRTELARSCCRRTTPLPPTSSPSLGPRERACLPRP